MPIVSGGGGGASLAPPVTLTGTNPNSVPLRVVGAPAQAFESFLVENDIGSDLFMVGPTGQAIVSPTDATLSRLFQVFASGGSKAIDISGNGAGGVGRIVILSDTSNISIEAGELDLGNSGAGTSCYINPRTVVFTDANVVPASSDLSAGDFALWLDPTNGASKLMVKAKSTDGTVVTAAVALA